MSNMTVKRESSDDESAASNISEGSTGRLAVYQQTDITVRIEDKKSRRASKSKDKSKDAGSASKASNQQSKPPRAGAAL